MIKIAVVSDMHCMHSSKEKPPDVATYLYSDDIGRSETRHPIKALKNLIDKDELDAYILLCPGDITNLADTQGLITGWSYLEKIRVKIGAKKLIATVGNHDVASRNDDIGNVNLDLQLLDANYPIPSDLVRGDFWTNGYSFVDFENILVLNINSCHFHNNSKTAKKSKIDISQLDSIRKELQKKDLTGFDYKIVLIHHHPIPHSNMDYEDLDMLDKGDELIALLNQYKFQILIHGHKHDARLTIYQSLPIFCAGSLSSLMNVKDLKSDNTFHIINLEAGEAKGYIESWIYAPQEGWVSRLDTRFPCLTGFGFNGDIKTLAKTINDWLSEKTKENRSYYEPLATAIPDLKFLTNANQVDLSKILETEYDLEFSPNYPNKPKLISKLIR